MIGCGGANAPPRGPDAEDKEAPDNYCPGASSSEIASGTRQRSSRTARPGSRSASEGGGLGRKCPLTDIGVIVVRDDGLHEVSRSRVAVGGH